MSTNVCRYRIAPLRGIERSHSQEWILVPWSQFLLLHELTLQHNNGRKWNYSKWAQGPGCSFALQVRCSMAFQLIHFGSVNIRTEPCFCHPYCCIFSLITHLTLLGVSLKTEPSLKAPVASLKSYRNVKSECVSVGNCVSRSPRGTAGFISVKMKPKGGRLRSWWAPYLQWL